MNRILFLALTASCISAIATPARAQDPYFNPIGAIQADCNRGVVGACQLLEELKEAEANGLPASSPDSPYQSEIEEIEKEQSEMKKEEICESFSYSFSDNTCAER